MTSTQAEDRVRRLLDQTDSSDTEFSSTAILEYVDQGRKTFSRILPFDVFPKLRKTQSITVSGGYAAYPSDYMKSLPDPYMKLDNIYADLIDDNDVWRLKFMESNNNVKSGSTVKRVRRTSTGWQVFPSTAATLSAEYFRFPDTLGGADNTDLPKDIEDMTIDFAFEKCMGTARGDVELATFLAKQRGYNIQSI